MDNSMPKPGQTSWKWMQKATEDACPTALAGFCCTVFALLCFVVEWVQAILFLPLQGHSVQVVPALDSHPFFLLVQTVQIQFSVFSCLSSLLIERALCSTEKMLMRITHTELVFYCFKNQTDLLTIGFSFLLKSKHFRSENEEVRL